VPSKRAYWGAYVFTLAFLRHKRVAALPAILAAVLAAEGASMAWQAMEDIHALAADRKEHRSSYDYFADTYRKAPDAAGAD